MKPLLPPDAYAMIGITPTDLYPASSWNFVFARPSLTGRVGVYSLARYDPVFSAGNAATITKKYSSSEA